MVVDISSLYNFGVLLSTNLRELWNGQDTRAAGAVLPVKAVRPLYKVEIWNVVPDLKVVVQLQR